MPSRPKLLAILDRNPFRAEDGVSYPIARQLHGLKSDWDIDLLWVRPSTAGVSDEDATEKFEFAFGEIIEVISPSAGKISRFLGESLWARPYSHHPVIPEPQLRKLFANRSYDAIYTAPTLVALWADAVARVLPRRPLLVLNLNDAVSEVFRRFSDLARMSELPLRARLKLGLRSTRVLYMPRLERVMLGLFDLVLVQTQRDREAIIADCGETLADRILLAPNGIKEELLQLPYHAASEKRLVHVGALAHNRRELLLWFVSRVYVKVRRELPDVTLHLVGSLSQRDRKYLESIPGITAHGFVDNLENVLQTATMSVAPMFMRTGLINKVLDSMAAGVPTSGIKAFNGIAGFRSGVHGFELDSAAQWVELLVGVLQRPQLLGQISVAGRSLVEDEFRWQTTISRINERMQTMIHS